jgi:urease accessory protein
MNAITGLDARMERSFGEAFVGLDLRAGRVGLTALWPSGSAKAILPRVDGGAAEVVFLNTSGGLTGGDKLDYGLRIGAGTQVTATTQTAERAYKSRAGTTARVGVHLSTAAGAHLDWLPQETIVFQGASLHRETRIDLASDASLIAVESVILGRAAMGETVTRMLLRDRRAIYRDGTLLHLEPLFLSDDLLSGQALGARPAILDGARAFASVVCVGAAFVARLAPLRSMLEHRLCRAASSVIDDRLTLRVLAKDPVILRAVIRDALALLRPDRPLPRVWQI